eukprot:2097257-Rhodomonas_salina.1
MRSARAMRRTSASASAQYQRRACSIAVPRVHHRSTTHGMGVGKIWVCTGTTSPLVPADTTSVPGFA